MKPKTRYPQKQTSRLWLRNKDHRDIVLNETYVNKMWMKKDGKDELVWQRYPREYMLLKMRQASGYPALHYFTALDIDREFAHSVSWSNNYNSSELWQLDSMFVAHSEYMTTQPFMVSIDGLNWATMNPAVENMSRMRKFGNDNSLCGCWWSTTGTNQVEFVLLHFEIDDDNNIAYYKSSFSAIFNEQVQNMKYICDTADGMLVMCNHRNAPIPSVGIYEVTQYGAVLCDMIPTNIHYMIVDNTSVGCRKGSFYAYAYHYTERVGNQYIDNVAVLFSSDKVNWEGTTLFRRSSAGGYSTPRYALCERNGYFYLYVVSDNVTHAYKTATGTWVDLNLLDYVDVNCIVDGSFVSGAYDKIRVVLNPNGDIPSDDVPSVNMWDLMLLGDVSHTENPLEGNFNNILMQDGHFCDYDKEYVGFMGWIGGAVVTVVFDNMIFTTSDKNFALIGGTYYEPNGAEPLMEGDYCYRGTTPVPPFWNPYTHYYIGDKVSYGTIWKCISACKGIPPSEGTYWTQIQQ